MPSSCGSRGPLILKHLRDTTSRHPPRRDKSKQKGGNQRRHHCKSQDAPVNSRGYSLHPTFRNDSLGQNVHQPDAQNQPQTAASQGAKEALHNQLPHELAAGGAQGRANRELPLTRGSFGQKQVRNVSTRNQQHQRHHNKRGYQARTCVALRGRPSLRSRIEHDFLAQEFQPLFCIQVLDGSDLLLKQRTIVHIDACLSLPDGNPRLQPRQHRQK